MLYYYRFWQALRVPGGSGSQNFETISIWRWSGCQSYVQTAFTHQEISLVLISLTGRANPKARVHLEGSDQWKIPMTPSGIKPMTFQLVAQCLNHMCPIVPERILGIRKSRQYLTSWVAACGKDLWSMGVEVSDDIRRYNQGEVFPA